MRIQHPHADVPSWHTTMTMRSQSPLSFHWMTFSHLTVVKTKTPTMIPTDQKWLICPHNELISVVACGTVPCRTVLQCLFCMEPKCQMRNACLCDGKHLPVPSSPGVPRKFVHLMKCNMTKGIFSRSCIYTMSSSSIWDPVWSQKHAMHMQVENVNMSWSKMQTRLPFTLNQMLL